MIDAKSARSAHDDLAFMRAVVEDSGRSQQVMGQGFLAGGLAYGGQVLLQSAQALGWLQLSSAWNLVVGLSGTVVFLAAICVITWKNRGAPKGGTAARAVNTAFSVLGLTNLVIVFIVGALALRLKSLAVWELYPAVVFALQGSGWLIAYCIRRRGWHLAVALGWFATAAAMGWWIGTAAYVLLVAFGLIAWMAVPGFVMMRQGPAGRRTA